MAVKPDPVGRGQIKSPVKALEWVPFKTRALLTTSLILLVMVTSIYIIARIVLLNRFTELETQFEYGEMQELDEVVERLYDELNYVTLNWSRSDELDQYLQGLQDSFPTTHVTVDDLRNMRVDLVALANTDGKIKYSSILDDSTGTFGPGPAELVPLMVRGGIFWGLQDKNIKPHRLLKTSRGAFLISASQVYPISGQGPSSGTVLLGRRMDNHVLEDFQKLTGLTVEFFQSENAPQDYVNCNQFIINGKNIYFHSTNTETRTGFVVIQGVDNQPAGIIKVILPRSIYQQGVIALNYLLIGMIIVAVAAMGANWIIITLSISRPMERLAQRVQKAADLKDQIQSLSDTESSELNQLSLPIQDALIRAQLLQQASYDRQMLVTRLFEQAREGFVILDSENLKILEVNQEFLSLLNLSSDRNPIGLPFSEQILPVLTSEGQIAFQKWLSNGHLGAGMAEIELPTNCETVQFIEASLSPIEVGGRRYLYTLLRDVSERRQLQKTLQERLAETTLLNRVIAVSTSNLETETVFETVCAELAVAYGVPQSSLAVIDKDTRTIRFVAEHISSGCPSILGEQISVEETTLTEILVRNRYPILINQVRSKPYLTTFQPMFEKRHVESVMMIPLVIRKEVIGLLVLESTVSRKFSAAEAALAKNIASAVSRAYEVTMLYQSLQAELQQRQQAELDLAKRERFLETLVEVQTHMLGGSNWNEVYPNVLKALGEVSQTDHVCIFKNYMGPDGGLYTALVAEWARPEIKLEIDNPALQSIAFTGPLQRVYDFASIGQPYSAIVSDLPEGERIPYQKQGILSFLVLPLTTGGIFSGLIGFDSLHQPKEWQPSEVALLMVAAAAISMAYERFDAIDAMRQSEERYRAVVENAHDVIFQMDLSGRFMFLNPSWERLTGIPLSESIGLPFWKVAPNGMLQQLQTAYRILRERVTDHYHQLMIFTDAHGETVWLDTFARMITNAEGRGMLIAGTMINISQFKRIEYQLRRNEESLRALYDITSSQQLTYQQKVIDLLSMGSRTFNLDTGSIGRISNENLIIEQIYPQDLCESGTVLNISDTFAREIVRANEPVGVEHAGETDWAGHPAYLKNPSETILGTSILVNNHVYGVLLFTGKNVRLHGFSIAEKEFARLMAQWVGAEIERDQYTQRLHQYNEEIAQKSSELAEARDQALETSRLKSEFLATMSHEIRTPLNAVIGMTELLLDTPLNTQQDEFAHIIQNSGKSLLGIINDILDFSKIEAGRLSLEKVEFDILPVVEDVVDMFMQSAHSKQVSIVSFVSPKIPRKLIGDPYRLRQILVNLVGNAIKFTEVGEIVVRVGMTSQDDNSIRLIFKVNDTGIGLSEVARRGLFQPFTQADGSTTRKYGGTGLGLAISKRLVEMMAGEIGVVSEENVGSTFWFTVNVDLSTSGWPRSAPSNLHGLHALVVDNEPTQRRFIASYLRSWHIIPESCSTANEAFIILENQNRENAPIQLIIWGLDEPGVNWREIQNYFNSHSGLTAVRTLFLAALDQRSNLFGLIHPERSAVIYRPIKQSNLLNAILDLFLQPVIEATPSESSSQRLVDESGAQKKKIVLLAEDNPANQRLAMAQLDRLGFQTEIAGNGIRALDAYLNHPERFDLILMDCQMPVMDGFEATAKIREFEKKNHRRIPIVAMTANALQGDREACIQAGMDEYISKPVTIEKLERILNILLDNQLNETAEPPTSEVVHNPLDLKFIKGLRDLQVEGEPDFLAELIDLFLEDSAVLMAEIKTGLDSFDMHMIRQAVHTLKGSGGSLGANQLVNLCTELETLTKVGTLENINKVYLSLIQEYGIVCAHLSRERVQ